MFPTFFKAGGPFLVAMGLAPSFSLLAMIIIEDR